MKTKSMKKKILVTIFALATVFSFTACADQEDIDAAVNPVSKQVTEIDGYVDALETSVSELETALATTNAELAALEGDSATKTALTEAKTALEAEIATIKTALDELKTKDSAFEGKISALVGRVETLEASVSALTSTIDSLQEQVQENTEKLEALENKINCLEDKHELTDCKYNDNDTHTGTCAHCEKSFTKDCDYGDWVENDDGTKSKTCATCEHTVIERIDVTIALKEDASVKAYWKDGLTVDLSTLLDITEGAGEVTYTLNSSSGSVSGSILSCPLVTDYKITVTTAETATHKAATFSFTYTVEKDPATDEFGDEWVTL